MPGRLADFVIIGAMKAGTSSLHEQLRRRPGVFMSDPKEPNFFSDEDNFARGAHWYASLFEKAGDDQICGESSTHYTKLPTHPRSVDRMRELIPEAKLIYVMRDPIDRILSQYVHEWTQRDVQGSLDVALQRQERYIAYSCYARQLEPYLQAFGSERVLPIAFERLLSHRDEELARVCRFIGDSRADEARWDASVSTQNVSQDRLRRSPGRDALLAHPWVGAVKERIPQRLRDSVKSFWQMRKRPELSQSARAAAEREIDQDLVRLGGWLGLDLDCRHWKERVALKPLAWSGSCH